MEYQYIEYNTKERLTYITLNRPEKRNAFNAQLVNELKHAFKTAEGDENSEEEELVEVMFKVIIEKSEPEGVKISKRNCCIVTIVSGGEEETQMMQEQKLLEYFLSTREPSWPQ